MQAASSDVPFDMLAAVYRGESMVAVERIAVPEIGPGELLLRVEACGVCHTDLKKVEYNLLPPPRVFGHETAGTVVAVGAGIQKFRVGDRVIAFHHIPCSHCFYCERGLYAQCKVYKRVGVTAGFEPAGGGFAQYVRVMHWIAEQGVERIPDGVSFDVASFVEPVNTCLKAVEQLAPAEGDVVIVMGQGPIGLIFTMLLAQRGVRVIATDTMLHRLELARQSGAEIALDPLVSDIRNAAAALTDGRGADAVILATAVKGLVTEAVDCSRPGAKILLFAQTSSRERIELSGASICVDERILFGSYSASVDVQKQSADLVFSGKLPLGLLISHRLPLARIHDAFELATRPTADSLKIVVTPNA